MFTSIFAILLAATVPQQTIVIDNTGCSTGRTGDYLALKAEQTAKAEARRLRAEGVDVRIVRVSDGADLGSFPNRAPGNPRVIFHRC